MLGNPSFKAPVNPDSRPAPYQFSSCGPRCQTHPSGPQDLTGWHRPRIHAHPHKLRSQAYHHRLRHLVNPSELRHKGSLSQGSTLWIQAPGMVTLWPTHHLPVQELQQQTPMDTTRCLTQNLWTGWLVKGFPFWSHTVKTGRGNYFLKCTDNEGHKDHKNQGNMTPPKEINKAPTVVVVVVAQLCPTLQPHGL